MQYLLRYHQLIAPGAFRKLEPDDLVDEWPSLDHGDVVMVQAQEYIVVGIPKLERIDHPTEAGKNAILIQHVVVEVSDWYGVSEKKWIWYNGK